MEGAYSVARGPLRVVTAIAARLHSSAMQGFYTTHEAARLLGVSLPTVVNWITARRLKAHRTPGGHRRISREDLAGFMVQHGVPLPEELSDAAPARRKALVVGEPGPAREGVARQLAAGGFAIDQASPGFAAGASLARFVPDLVILGASGPDGGESLSGLRADRELGSVPVLGIGRPEWVVTLSAAGCTEVLVPPLADGTLVETAKRLLGPPQAAAPRGRRRRA
jgi:excisionase family DNA binding protein